MSTPQVEHTPVVNPTTSQTPIGSGSASLDAETAAAKKALAKETASASILTSGNGILEDPKTKKNLLG